MELLWLNAAISFGGNGGAVNSVDWYKSADCVAYLSIYLCFQCTIFLVSATAFAFQSPLPPNMLMKNSFHWTFSHSVIEYLCVCVGGWTRRREIGMKYDYDTFTFTFTQNTFRKSSSYATTTKKNQMVKEIVAFNRMGIGINRIAWMKKKLRKSIENPHMVTEH